MVTIWLAKQKVLTYHILHNHRFEQKQMDSRVTHIVQSGTTG